MRGAKESFVGLVALGRELEEDDFFGAAFSATAGAATAAGLAAFSALAGAGVATFTGASTFLGASFLAVASLAATVVLAALAGVDLLGAGFLGATGFAVFGVTRGDFFFVATGFAAAFLGLAEVADLVLDAGMGFVFDFTAFATGAGFLTTLTGFLEAPDLAGLLFFAGMAENEVEMNVK